MLKYLVMEIYLSSSYSKLDKDTSFPIKFSSTLRLASLTKQHNVSSDAIKDSERLEFQSSGMKKGHDQL